MDCSLFRSGDYGKMLRSRMLRMCEKDCPRAVLVNGEVHMEKDVISFFNELKTMNIAYYQSLNIFEESEYREVFKHFLDSFGNEMGHPKNDVLYRMNLKAGSIERFYLNLFIRHEAIDEQDILAEIEERLRQFGNEVSTIVIKQKMN